MAKKEGWWVSVLKVVDNPLSLIVLVVLVIEGILGSLAGISSGKDRMTLVSWILFFLAGLIIMVVLLAIFRPQVLGSRPFSLLLGLPKRMEGLDITRIDWDEKECFLISGSLKERILPVQSRVGPSFRVTLSHSILHRIKEDEPVGLELKDQKGNRWRVRRFFLFENLLPLSVVESEQKLLDDYGGDYE